MKLGKIKLGILLVGIPAYILMMGGCSTGTYGYRAPSGDPDPYDHGRDDHHQVDNRRPDDRGRDDHRGGDDRRDEHSGIRVHESFHGGRPGNWHRMDHVAFDRHEFVFDWNHIHAVTCVAGDNYNDHYPFTEDSYRRDQWQDGMANIEQNALDYCFNTSPIGSTCHILTCTSL